MHCNDPPKNNKLKQQNHSRKGLEDNMESLSLETPQDIINSKIVNYVHNLCSCNFHSHNMRCD